MIVYFSGASGFTDRFVSKLGMEAKRIPLKLKEAEGFTVEDPFVLFLPTYERPIIRGPKAGQISYIPAQVSAVLRNRNNREKMAGVIGFGNMSFFSDYARAGDDVSKKAGVPLLTRVELGGTEEDVERVRKGLKEFWEHTGSPMNHRRSLMLS